LFKAACCHRDLQQTSRRGKGCICVNLRNLRLKFFFFNKMPQLAETREFLDHAIPKDGQVGRSHHATRRIGLPARTVIR